MKKTLFTLMALICTMSINAQIVKIYRGDQLIISHKVLNGDKVVFEKAPDLGIKGKTERTGGIEVNWVQLWEGGPRFAEYNVGAENNKAEDCGGLYCWGMTADKGTSGAYKDGESDLIGYDDTATNLWGEGWRMPTKEEFDNLLAKCDVKWIDGSTEKYNNTTVTGLLCTGNDAYSSNSVFLPAAGRCDFGYVNDQGNFGYYWSSTHSGSDLAYYLYFNSGLQGVSDDIRELGYSVRAVLKE